MQLNVFVRNKIRNKIILADNFYYKYFSRNRILYKTRIVYDESVSLRNVKSLIRVGVDSANEISRCQTYFSRSPSKFVNIATIEKNRETSFSVLRDSRCEKSRHAREPASNKVRQNMYAAGARVAFGLGRDEEKQNENEENGRRGEGISR